MRANAGLCGAAALGKGRGGKGGGGGGRGARGSRGFHLGGFGGREDVEVRRQCHRWISP